MSNFAFLKSEWPDLYAAALEAEQQVQTAPRSCLFSCRYALERATRWLYKHDDYLKEPYNDDMCEASEVEFSGNPASIARYRMKVQQYLQKHQNYMTIHKIRMNKPITGSDIQELERMLDGAEEVGGKDRFKNAFDNGKSLGELIRDLVGLDRIAAQAAFGDFLKDERYNANQIHFVNQILEHLIPKGVMEPELLFESPPFTDNHTSGVAGVFPIEDRCQKGCRLLERRE